MDNEGLKKGLEIRDSINSINKAISRLEGISNALKTETQTLNHMTIHTRSTDKYASNCSATCFCVEQSAMKHLMQAPMIDTMIAQLSNKRNELKQAFSMI